MQLQSCKFSEKKKKKRCRYGPAIKKKRDARISNEIPERNACELRERV